jgi:hypothetical protein
MVGFFKGISKTLRTQYSIFAVIAKKIIAPILFLPSKEFRDYADC